MRIQASGLQLGKAAATPGVKPDEAGYEAVLEDLDHSEVQAGQLDGNISAATGSSSYITSIN